MASWAVLERSWDVRGGFGRRLGRLLGALEAILERPVAQSDFGSIFSSILNRKGCPNGGIWRTKMEPKSNPK